MMNSSGVKNHKRNNKNIIFALGVIFLLVIWSIIARIINNELMLPSIINTGKSLVELLKSNETYVILFSTMLRLLLGVFISILLGFFMFLLLIWRRNTIYFFRPLLAIAKTTPIAALIIILLIWFGSVYSPIIISIFVLFPLVVETLLLGLEKIDCSYLEEMKLNGDNYVYSLVHVYIPFVKPYFFMSLLQCFGLGMKVMVTAELISQTPNSIGLQMYLHKIYLDIPGLFAWTVILVIIVVAFEVFIQRLQKKLMA